MLGRRLSSRRCPEIKHKTQQMGQLKVRNSRKTIVVDDWWSRVSESGSPELQISQVKGPQNKAYGTVGWWSVFSKAD